MWQKYKTQIIGGIIGIIITGGIPGSVWLHNAYADDRYVQQADAIRMQIQQIDNALFEIGQEVVFAENDEERAKWQARKEYYEREKESLRDLLESQ